LAPSGARESGESAGTSRGVQESVWDRNPFFASGAAPGRERGAPQGGAVGGKFLLTRDVRE
jgi:hypothetical protein